MVFSLAPNMRSSGWPKIRMTAVRTSAMRTSMVVQFPRIFSALSFSPFPIMMEALGAPPMLTRAAKAEIAMMSGMVTPTPVRASGPMSLICPMYIRSTILYMTLMIWATMAGRASLKRRLPMGPFPRSASFVCAFFMVSPHFFQFHLFKKELFPVIHHTKERTKCQLTFRPFCMKAHISVISAWQALS